MTIQWYPGHIAKAERELKEQLKRVDVVLEVRDARIPLSTNHPQMREWVSSKARVLVLNRVDMIPQSVRQLWTEWFQAEEETPYFTDAQHGKGVSEVAKAAQATGVELNKRRRDRGMLPRPVRAVVIGFPNVGKSALINRLLGRRVVESARRAGVTRQLRWVRISETIELLDAPGIIPWKLDNQTSAIKLAICDDIGQAGYDNQRVTASLIDLLKQVELEAKSFNLKISISQILKSRYGLDPIEGTGEDYLQALAEHSYKGDSERVARHILNDFRTGILGSIPLELPPI